MLSGVQIHVKRAVVTDGRKIAREGGGAGAAAGGPASKRQRIDDAGSNAPHESTKIFVGNLSKTEHMEESLASWFAQFGAVRRVEVKRDNAGASRGFGFVIFEEPAGSETALLSGLEQQMGPTGIVLSCVHHC